MGDRTEAGEERLERTEAGEESPESPERTVVGENRG